MVSNYATTKLFDEMYLFMGKFIPDNNLLNFINNREWEVSTQVENNLEKLFYYLKVDVCQNGCNSFNGSMEYFDQCPTCGTDRFEFCSICLSNPGRFECKHCSMGKVSKSKFFYKSPLQTIINLLSTSKLLKLISCIYFYKH
jgi:hypothetical protein